ncbi:MAG: AmmeMemoRadiSam system protein B, partial [Pirellulales bacterium]|nr:AmmeMemoRadiSam system protein B [Pirellulales bacterium]
INGKLSDAVDVPGEPAVSGGPSPTEVAALADFCRQNVAVMLQGATPNCYMPGGYDGNVNGLRLTLDISPPGSEAVAVEECSMLTVKPGMPLQSSLFNLARAMSETLRRRRVPLHVASAAKVGLSVLFDPAMHGPAVGTGGGDVMLEKVGLEGIDTKHRAVVVLQQAGWTWNFDPQKNADEVMHEALVKAHLSKGTGANLLSMEIVSTEERASSGNVPDPQSPRPPAVAGQFYPGTSAQMDTAVDALIKDAGRHTRKPWAGAIVPHAGWVYSGKLAADVLSRVEFPKNVIIFAPKHRPGGARWAVSPATRWLLPGTFVNGDEELAKNLADCVDAFELDAVAHRQEHSVEVQLPIIAKMSPETKVTAVVMHGGEWDELSTAAEQLAAVLKDLPERPFLLISSDMNHYASDEETRRLDRLALDRIEALDPQALLKTVREKDISMCGAVPAVLVMETLKQLGCLERSELVGHTNSGEVSGDTGKVVGYAGVLFG